MGLKGKLIWVVTGLLAAAFLSGILGRGGESMSDDARSMNYRGQPVHLTRPYDSYEEYKDDPNNIAPEENARVAKLVAEAPIQKRFSSRREMIETVFGLRFPGYGLSSFGEKPQPDGSVLTMQAIEIPRANRDRFLTFHGTGNAYVLIDDFIVPTSPQIKDVQLVNGSLSYLDRSGKLIAKHTSSGE